MVQDTLEDVHYHLLLSTVFGYGFCFSATVANELYLDVHDVSQAPASPRLAVVNLGKCASKPWLPY